MENLQQWLASLPDPQHEHSAGINTRRIQSDEHVSEWLLHELEWEEEAASSTCGEHCSSGPRPKESAKSTGRAHKPKSCATECKGPPTPPALPLTPDRTTPSNRGPKSLSHSSSTSSAPSEYWQQDEAVLRPSTPAAVAIARSYLDARLQEFDGMLVKARLQCAWERYHYLSTSGSSAGATRAAQLLREEVTRTLTAPYPETVATLCVSERRWARRRRSVHVIDKPGK